MKTTQFEIKLKQPFCHHDVANEDSSHKIDKTEGTSDQFPIWIFNFWSYGQLRAVRGKIQLWIMSNFWASLFYVFMGKRKYCSFRTKKVLNITFIILIFLFFLRLNKGTLLDLNPEESSVLSLLWLHVSMEAYRWMSKN